MEAALFSFNLLIMLLLVLWSARSDPPGRLFTGRGLFDMLPGADCDNRRPAPAPNLQDDVPGL